MKEIAIETLNLNALSIIPNDWMLITAGTKENGFNTMTASWGHMGCIWNRLTAVAYIRPQRYTKEFVDREELYTLSFFPQEYKKQLSYLGSHSGRDEDKVAAVGFTPVFGEGFTTFKEASLTLVCRKLYRATLTEEGFLDKGIFEKNYPGRDLHDMYISEIVHAFVAEE